MKKDLLIIPQFAIVLMAVLSAIFRLNAVALGLLGLAIVLGFFKDK